ncbi:MAG TPA: MFS transporter [Kofleriaceae bacterium]|nr:MFS transporter [Kofleriaceae bacterium]
MTSRSRKLSAPAWWFIGGYGLSATGTGLCYPFLAIYLRQALGRSSQATALLLLLQAGAAVPMSVIGGRWCDRHSPQLVAVAALGVQTAGWVVLAVASNLGGEILAMLLIGLGTGPSLAAVVPILTRIIDGEAARTRAFALRYQLLNVGLGLGAMIAAFALNSPSVATYRLLCAFNGLSCLLYALIIVVCVPVPGAAAPAADAAPVRAWYRPGGSFRLLLGAQFLLVTFGLVQLEAGVPLFVRTRMDGSATLIGSLYALSTLIVIAAQMPISRLVERVHKARALIAMSLVWALAWMTGFIASTTMDSGTRTGLLVAMVVLFSAGECAYSPAFYTLVTNLSPAGALGRSSGAAWAMHQVGSTVGPPLAVFLVAGPVSLWLVLAGASVLAAMTVAVVDRRMHRHRDVHTSPAETVASSA